jgi:hypothetical protein
MATQQPAQNPPSPVTGLLIGLLMVGGALFGYWNIYQEYATARVSDTWPTATGTIDSVYVRTTPNKRKGRETWTVDVLYTYEVEGKGYTGDVLRFGGFPSTSDFGEAQETEAKYAKGTTHPVYYQPGNPERAVLVPGAGSALASLSLGAFLLLLVLGLGLIPLMGSLKLMREK